ncbi:mitoferrin-2-like [Xiphophorus maculatus]|uniref:Solute carrier family 25 member 28 n=1 Tax=Xiphophorus maculatus TaxID=8083 RepID=M3ZU04_XIPMA|nr:mitoferrin-2-like [Xiphophorus maculatus]XP_032419641.1 mitoferrin-2-like [Xiphophorus hellerii]
MEADGFVPSSTLESPAVERRVTGTIAATGFGIFGNSVLDATGGFVGSFTPRMTGEPDFVSMLHRATPEPSASVEPEVDYEGLPQGAASSTHMLAGAVAGIMEHCLMYPVDCVKTRMQSLHPEPGARYRNVMDALRQIVRTEGLWRPIRGVNVLAVGAGPAHALYFACYEKIKFSLSDAIHPGTNSHFANGVAGCAATVLHDAIMNPAEVVKQRMQMFNSPYRGVLDCMGSLLRQEGPAAFYRSYTTQLTMNVPFQALHFMTYEYLQELLNPHRQYNPSSHVVSGALAGALAAAATTPLDVCKTLLNTQEAQAVHVIQAGAAATAAAASGPESRYISGLSEAFRTVYRTGGVPAFFKGVQARVIYQMPSTAISWSVYEFFKYIITKRQHEKRLRGDRDGDK